MNDAANRAFILLAAHNGERFVAQQIESLRAQAWASWQLLVHDDHSVDATAAILDSLAAHDSRIKLLPPAGARLGAAGSFERLLEYALHLNASYAFFCDQDDVWLPHKLEGQMRALGQAGRSAGHDTPILVHSDLSVVDARLEELHPSYREYNGVSYDRGDPIATLLLHNAVVGCTAGFNTALMRIALPFPAGVYHDWWLAMCAAAGGIILDERAPTVFYRQHATNLIGARGRHAFIPRAIRHPRRFVSSAFEDFRVGIAHAFALEERMRERPQLFSNEAHRRVASYCSVYRRGRGVVSRLRALVNSGVHPERQLSYPILYALAAVYPRLSRR